MKKNIFQKINKTAGFTIIETMIAISLFLIIVTIGMGSLLNANLLHQKSQDMRSIMDNLSFIMEDMSRNLRTGYDYQSAIGGEISFKHINNGTEEQWAYKIYDDGSIRKSIDNGTEVQLNPDEIKISEASGFTVTGTEPGDSLQPFVTIKLIGTITSPKDNIVTPFSLQTSVSQRLIDTEAPQTPEAPPLLE